MELKLREEALKDLKRLAKCVRAGGGWLYILVKLFSGFISLLFVCQRRDILHYANDFLWRKSFIAFSIPVLEDVTSGKKLVIILEKCSALSLLLAKHLKLPQEEQEYSEATERG